MGFARTVFILGIQNSVAWEKRGVATASNMFMNILGCTVGAALLGGILNSNLVHYLTTANGQQTINMDVTNILLDPVKRGTLPHEVLTTMTSALAFSLHYVNRGLFSFAALSLIIVLFFPVKAKETI